MGVLLARAGRQIVGRIPHPAPSAWWAQCSRTQASARFIPSRLRIFWAWVPPATPASLALKPRAATPAP